MPFLVYAIVLFLTAGAAALGLDLLTAPTPDAKPPAQVASNATGPKPIRQIPLGRPEDAETPELAAERNRALTPIYPANPAKAIAARTDTEQAQADVAPQVPASAPPVTAALAMTPSAPTAPATPVAAAPATEPQPQPVAAVTEATAPQTSNSCDVQACASTYRSFRASDCTYQPFDGPRRLCVRQDDNSGASRTADNASRPADASPDVAAAPRPNREQQLRDVVRRVKELTARDYRDYYDEEDDPRARRVIVIETHGDGYAAPYRQSFGRRWSTWP